eukprot:scaffold116353_cov66-Phaeocystis_antarctica.AAC.3
MVRVRFEVLKVYWLLFTAARCGVRGPPGWRVRGGPRVHGNVRKLSRSCLLVLDSGLHVNCVGKPPCFTPRVDHPSRVASSVIYNLPGKLGPDGAA